MAQKEIRITKEGLADLDGFVLAGFFLDEVVSKEFVAFAF